MASFNFGNDSEDLDLTTGGDQGAAPRKPAVRKPAPQTPAAQQPAQTATPRPARPATNGRTANLLHGQTPPAPPKPQQNRPARQAPQPQVQAPVVRPTAPVQQPTNFPPSTPQVEPTPQVEQSPVYQPPQPQPVYQQPQEAPYTPPASQQPVYEQPTQAPAYEPPAQNTPMYQPPTPQYASGISSDDFEPAPLPQRDPVRRPSSRQPAFMSRDDDGQETPEITAPITRSTREPKPVVERERSTNPLMAFFAPFLGQGSNQNGRGKSSGDGGKKPPVKNRARTPQNNYAGSRQRVLFIRVAFGIVGGIVILAGLHALLFPYQGPSKIAVQNAAKEAVNYTGFPDATGQGVATAFTTLFLNYSSADNSDRDAQLLRYTTKDILGNIDLSTNSTALDSSNTASVKQTIIQGPYLISEKDADATHSLITTASRLNTGQWMYMSIPLLYDAKTGSVTVSGSPSFEPQTVAGSVPTTDYTANWTDDSTQDAIFKPDLVNYLIAWAAGTNQSVISRYITNDASPIAHQGLGGTVIYNSLIDGPTIEAIDPKSGADPNSRRGQFTVLWENPLNHVTYPQTYRVQLVFQQNHWFIKDITNISLISGN